MSKDDSTAPLGPDDQSSSTSHYRSFKHRPLDLQSKSIRLFKLLLASSSSTHLIHGEVQHFELEEAPSYKALSYTWGPSSPSREVLLGDQVFSTSENLYAFLENLHGNSGTSADDWLWIDQLCIDQQNVLERNHQVSQMAEIYRSASEVIVWLGSRDGEAKTLADGLRKNLHISTTGSGYDRRMFQQAFIQFLHCQYWFRTWILQEFLLATTLVIYWGKASLSLYDLDGLLVFGQRYLARHCHGHSLQPKLDQLMYLHRHRQQRNNVDFYISDWIEALKLSHSTKCHDLRDRVYALLGLVHPKIAIKADYAASPEEIRERVLTATLLSKIPPLRIEPIESYDAVRINLSRLLEVSSVMPDSTWMLFSPASRKALCAKALGKEESARVIANRNDGPALIRILFRKATPIIRSEPLTHSRDLDSWTRRHVNIIAFLAYMMSKDKPWWLSPHKVSAFLQEEYTAMKRRHGPDPKDPDWQQAADTFFAARYDQAKTLGEQEGPYDGSNRSDEDTDTSDDEYDISDDDKLESNDQIDRLLRQYGVR